MTLASLAERIIALGSNEPKKIFIIGDGMMDIYVYGEIAVEKGQEGCPKFMEKREVIVPGGAGNASRALKSWPVRVWMIVNPEFGPIKTRYLIPALYDTTKYECIFRHDNDGYEAAFDMPKARAQVIEFLNSWAPDVILISDYDKGFLTKELMLAVQNYAVANTTPLVVDAKLAPHRYLGAIIKGNSIWATKHNFNRGVISRGSEMPVVYGEVLPYEAPPVDANNVVGAGDAFSSHLAMGLAYGLSLKDSAALAHAAGRVYVQQLDNTPPASVEVLADLAQWRSVK